MRKRVLSVLLALAMVLSLTPGAAWAENGAISAGSQAEDELLSNDSQDGTILPGNDQNEGGSGPDDPQIITPVNEPEEGGGENPAGEPEESSENSVGGLEEDEGIPLELQAEDVMPLDIDLTAGEPIEINKAEDLAAIKDNLSGSYKLTGKIDLTGEWTPIGSLSAPFTGTFDGGGYTIGGLIINAGNKTYQGLFGKIGKDGVVENLSVEGTISSTQSSNAWTGGIAGQVEDGSIINCVSRVKIDAKGNKIGGVAGDVSGAAIFTGCANLDSVKAKGMAGGIIGGMSGTAKPKIKNCYNTGAITPTGSNCGGLIGYTSGNVTIENCYSTGTVSTIGTNCGALIGLLTSTSTAKNCYWLGDESTVGIGSYSATSITNCSFKTGSELKEAAFLDTLNQNAPDGSHFAMDSKDINGGYPVLEFQNPKTEQYKVTFELTPAEANLTVKDAKGASQSGKDGVYGLPAGEYRYSASAFGYKTEEKDFSVINAADPGTIKVVLAETQRQTVTFSGLPQGAVLTVSHATAGPIKPESGGGYRLPPGEYSYTAVAKGYEPLVNQTLMVATEPVNKTVVMTPLSVAQPWDGTARTAVTPIGGIYYIKSGVELVWFADQINAKNLLDAQAVLLADI
ncbi:MAG TPA: hypothetical protein PKA19_15520, partial [Bacillota bacterium]|nr:hypothetical protein [Bacillota bacterium]